MTIVIPRTKPIEQVIERYQTLNQELRRELTDFYNSLFGLMMYAHGTDDQRDLVRNHIVDSERQGRKHFPACGGRKKLETRIPASVIARDGEFKMQDLDHFTELNHLIGFVNNAGEYLAIEEARTAYELLIPYLYGRRDKR